MRNYLIALLLVVGFSSQAQVHTVRTDGKVTPVDYDLSARYSLKIPVVADTASAFLHGGVDSLGCVIQVRSTGHWWKRDTVTTGGHKWVDFGAGGSGIDSSLAATKYGVDTAKQTLRNSIATKKNNSDSLLQPGYVTHSQDDTAKQVIRNAIALKASQSALHDTAAAIRADFPSGSAGTDSSDAIDWGLRKRVVSKVRYYSPDSAKLTTKQQLQATIDSLLGVIAKKQDTSARFNLYVVADGQPGDSLLVASDSVLHQPKIRDSLDFHHYKRPDGSWTLSVNAHDTLPGANRLGTGYQQDSARKNIYAAIGAVSGGISDTTALMRKSNNLADVVNADTARKNIAALGNLKTLGTLYNANTWVTGDLTSTFTYTGSQGSASIVLGKIQLTGGNQLIGATTNSAFNGVLRLTGGYGGTMLPYWKMAIKYKVTSTPSSSTSGIAPGLISTSILGSLSNGCGYFNTTTTGTQTASLVLGTTNTNASTAATSLIDNQNDYLLMIVERRFDKMLVSVKNLTTDSASVNAVFVYDGTNASAINVPNTGVFGIANLGGTIIIDSISITSDVPYNPNLYFAIDSKGTYSCPQDASTGALMNYYYPGTVIASGPTDVSGDLNFRIHEILLMHPKQILVGSFPRNDQQFGIAAATWRQNLRTFDSTMTANGILVIWTDGIFENQSTQLAGSTYIDSAFTPRIIRTLKVGAIAANVSSDNIHPSIAGAKVFANTVYLSGKIAQYASRLNGAYKPDDRLFNPTFDSVRLVYSLHMDNGSYHPATFNAGDIGVREGASLRAAFGAATQQNSITICNSSNAAMDFENDLGGTQINNSPAFRFRGTSGNPTGTVGNIIYVDEDGGIANINPGIRPSILARWMAYRTYINHGFWGGNLQNTDSSFAGYVPYDSTSGSWMWNPSPTGTVKIYVSGGTHGGMQQAMKWYPTKKTEISDTLLTPKWPNKSSLAGTDSIDIVDASGIHYKAPVGLVGGSGTPFAVLQKYTINLASTYDARSFIDKNYDDSARAAAITAALAAYAPLSSPVFTGNITTPGIIGSGSTPSMSVDAGVPSTGGTTSGVSSGSNSVAGSFFIIAGTGTGSGTGVCTITLPVAQSSANFRVFLQSTSVSAHINVAVTNIDATHFSVSMESGGTWPASESHSWNYLIIQ